MLRRVEPCTYCSAQQGSVIAGLGADSAPHFAV